MFSCSPKCNTKFPCSPKINALVTMFLRTPGRASTFIETFFSLDSRILIDTGSGGSTKYVTNLKDTLSQHEVNIREILVTHWHADHVGGISDVVHSALQTGNVLLQ